MNPLLKANPNTPVDTLIDRIFEQRELCIEKKWFELAQTLEDAGRYILAMKLAAEL